MNEPGKPVPGWDETSSAKAPGDGPVPGVIVVETKTGSARLTTEACRLLGITPACDVTVDRGQLPGPLLELSREALAGLASIGGRRLDLSTAKRGKVSVLAVAVPVQAGAADSLVVLSLTDMSWADSSDKRLRRLDRLASAGTLASGMAHEIKNAMVASRTFIDLLLEKKPDAELAEVVRRELGRIDAMVSRMLKFAAPAAANFGPVHVHQVLEHSLRLVQPKLASKFIEVQRSFEAASDLTAGDEYELEQAFVNLLLNALEAMGESGKLTISTGTIETGNPAPSVSKAAGPPRLRINIQDTGPGIPPQNLEHLFEPFFTTKPSGTGLGLAVTYRVVQEHGGTIQAESRQGEGTTFSITLPGAAADR